MGFFGTKIRQARKEAGKTLKEVGNAIGFSIVYVCDIEKGRRRPPSDDRLRLMADFLNLDFKEVKGWACQDGKAVVLAWENNDGYASRAALALQRNWTSLTEDEASAIEAVFQEKCRQIS